MTVLTLVSFAVLFAYSSADETKENVVATDGQCYVALRSPLSWADAENDCASKGGHLASVKSEDVSKALRERLNASSSLWIGATYDGLLKKWRWSDGSPFEYAKWKQGHPVNKTALCSVLNTDGEWTSNDCGVPLRYVCRVPQGNKDGFCEGLPSSSTPNPSTLEPGTANPSTRHPSTSIPSTEVPTTSITSTSNPSTTNPSTPNPSTASPSTPNPSTPNPSTSTPNTPKSCTNGWEAIEGVSGRCFRLVRQETVWRDGLRKCDNLGGDLAHIENEEQNRLLSEFLTRKDVGAAAIGLSRKDSKAPWTWTNGSPVTYTNIDEAKGDDGNNCAFMMHGDRPSFRWSPQKCTSGFFDIVHPSLCERKA